MDRRSALLSSSAQSCPLLERISSIWMRNPSSTNYSRMFPKGKHMDLMGFQLRNQVDQSRRILLSNQKQSSRVLSL
uniref:Uncharacterized protein n=1 Tax=Arundo donax TaxID=35708 RepID=A0A0A9AZP3_ARUDO